MLLDMQELSELLGKQDGVAPLAFAAVCLTHGPTARACSGRRGREMFIARETAPAVKNAK